MTYSRADLPVGSGTLLRKSRVICSWVFIRWRKESTSDCKIKREKVLGFRDCYVVHDSIVQSNHWSCVMWWASKHRGTLVFAPVIEGNWKNQECRKGLGCLSPPPCPPLILPDCFAPFVNSFLFYRFISIKDKMKRLFFLNAATHVENGEKNLIARKSPQ